MSNYDIMYPILFTALVAGGLWGRRAKKTRREAYIEHVATDTKMATAVVIDGANRLLANLLPKSFGDFNVDIRRLDYSLNSLQELDSFLETAYRLRKQRPEVPVAVEDASTFLTLIGSYLGETLRRNCEGRLYWRTFENCKNDANFQYTFRGRTKSPTDHILMTDNGQNSLIIFPLEKVAKFMRNGPEDSLFSYASHILATLRKLR
jgi:hypothetical protein